MPVGSGLVDRWDNGLAYARFPTLPGAINVPDEEPKFTGQFMPLK
jgi:hypothetical protein